jgi:hypothetical protein
MLRDGWRSMASTFYNAVGVFLMSSQTSRPLGEQAVPLVFRDGSVRRHGEQRAMSSVSTTSRLPCEVDISTRLSCAKKAANRIGEGGSPVPAHLCVPRYIVTQPRITRDPRLHLPNPTPIHIARSAFTNLRSRDARTSKLTDDTTARRLSTSLR